MSGGGSEPGDTFQVNAPSRMQQPYLANLFGSAAQQFNRASTPDLPQTQVDPNANIMAGWQGTLDYARTGGQDVSQQALGGFGNLMESIDVANSPLVKSQVQSAGRQIGEQFREQILPGISSEALGAGQYGGRRQGVAEGRAAAGATSAIADATSNIMADAYRTGSQNAQFALGQAANAWNLGNMPSLVQGQVGQAQAQWEQAALDDQLAQFYWQQQRPWDLLSMYQGLITGNYGGRGQSFVM